MLGRGFGSCKRFGVRESLVCVRSLESSLVGMFSDGEEGRAVNLGSGVGGEGRGSSL